MDKNFLGQEVRKALSDARIDAYRLMSDHDDVDAISRYLWNMALCEALYPALQSFEVVLRNTIHDSLASYYNPFWFQDPQRLRPQEINKVRAAEATLRAEGKPIEPGRVVAELTLGFWTALFFHAYDRTIVLPTLNRGLRGFPSFLRNRRTLSQRFDEVRFLRNRVFHYEPIWHWTDLPARHQNLMDYTGYINLTQQKLLKLNDRFDIIHQQGWKHYRVLVERSLITAPSPSGGPSNTIGTGSSS